MAKEAISAMDMDMAISAMSMDMDIHRDIFESGGLEKRPGSVSCLSLDS